MPGPTFTIAHRQLEVATEAQGALYGYRTTEDAVLREPNAAGLAARAALPLRVAVARVCNEWQM